jgi:hypothetical protein
MARIDKFGIKEIKETWWERKIRELVELSQEITYV